MKAIGQSAEKPKLEAAGWRSVDQLAEMWGMDLRRARLVVEALLSSGRMEQLRQDRSTQPFYRLVVA